jgi:hypothetical protein
MFHQARKEWRADGLRPFFGCPAAALEAPSTVVDTRVGFRRTRAFPSRKRINLMARTDRRFPAPASDLKAMVLDRERKIAVSGAIRRSSRSKRLLGTLHLPALAWPC